MQNEAKRLEVQRETAKKDFPNVLKKIPLNIPYGKADLEFEFDLPWEELKNLLDRSCEYQENEKGQIKIISKEKQFREAEKTAEHSNNPTEHLTASEWEELYKLFSKSRGFKGRGYSSLKISEIPPNKLELVKKADRCSVLYIERGIKENRIGLIKWVRGIRKK